MPASSPRICIFCGRTPERKNLEHPLPRWLLSLTGDPNRVVRHGFSWATGEILEFSFDSLKFPSCKACNGSYSALESAAKPIVAAITRKEAVSPGDYVLLLDWLDKVRIGLWLGHRYLQKNASAPNFTIDSRIGRKDRMVAVYTIGDHQIGLNTWGPETPLFQSKPSVFSLRVNNTLFLNASWDWMCAGGCGYLAPQSREIDLSTGLLEASGFRITHPTHPIMSGIMKPCVLLFQPVLQKPDDSRADTWPGRDRVGPLFRQFANRTEQIGPHDEPLEFDSVSLAEANRTVDIGTQAYCLQNKSVSDDQYVGEPPDVAAMKAARKSFVRWNRKIMVAIRRMTPDEYLRALGRNGVPAA
jgi:hypothetical protein